MHSPPQGLHSAKAGRRLNKAQSLVVNSIIKLPATYNPRGGGQEREKENMRGHKESLGQPGSHKLTLDPKIEPILTTFYGCGT